MKNQFFEYIYIFTLVAVKCYSWFNCKKVQFVAIISVQLHVAWLWHGDADLERCSSMFSLQCVEWFYLYFGPDFIKGAH